jgi:hypothetical protein
VPDIRSTASYGNYDFDKPSDDPRFDACLSLLCTLLEYCCGECYRRGDIYAAATSLALLLHLGGRVPGDLLERVDNLLALEEDEFQYPGIDRLERALTDALAAASQKIEGNFAPRQELRGKKGAVRRTAGDGSSQCPD